MSNFFFKRIMSKKKFVKNNIFSLEKLLGQKMFLVKKKFVKNDNLFLNLVQKTFGSKNFWVKKIFGSKKIFGHKIFFGQKIVGSKNIWGQENFG